MKRSIFGALLFLLSLGMSAPASAIFKCNEGGKTVYADLPCDGGKVLDIDAAAPPDASASSRQLTQEKNKLKALERDRHKREAAEDRNLQKASGKSAARHKKCAAHARRQQLANDDVRRSTGIANEKARRKAQRITDAYEAECGRWYERELSLVR